MNWNKAIRIGMEESDMPQEELARRSRVHRKTINDYFRDRKTPKRISVLEKIANGLGMKFSEFAALGEE